MAELLSTFAAPSPAESAIVRERILNIAADLLILDTEIGRLKKILKGLRHNRKALQRLSIGHHNVLNPTRRLPIEILGEIFIQLQHMLGGRSIAPTKVCRQWREVAIGTSKLWNHIKISYLNQMDVYMVPIWLQRSSGQPLTIELGRQGTVWGHAKRENTAVHDMIASHAHRWKDVKLHITDTMVSFLQNIPGDFPMLHNLYITGLSRNLAATWPQNFNCAFSLRILTLEKCVYLPISTFPWAKLTKCTLTGGNNSCQDGYHVLSQAVNLQTFVMNLDARFPFSPTPLNHLSLSNLSTLDIIVISGEKSEDLFNLLTLPALIDLKVLDRWSSNPFEYTADMVIRSRCSLKKLSLQTRGTLTAHIPLRNLFNAIPSLSELELLKDAAAGWDDSMMDFLTHVPYHAADLCCPLPKLTSVKLTVHRAFSYRKFVDFLSSRHHATTCTSGGTRLAQLRTAVLAMPGGGTVNDRWAYYVDQETYEEFVELRESGLDLYFMEMGGRRTLEDYLAPEDKDDSETDDEEDCSETDGEDDSDIDEEEEDD
ncbi:hypothetical protein HWV62_35538 [Athelia sp. TMB]|nr:hypothetical protein HWV62_35538 [Athelia sp. TMB]